MCGKLQYPIYKMFDGFLSNGELDVGLVRIARLLNSTNNEEFHVPIGTPYSRFQSVNAALDNSFYAK